MTDLVLGSLRTALQAGFPKKLFWRLAYDRAAAEQPDAFSLMNYGYLGSDDALTTSEEGVCQNLYHRVASAVDLRGSLVLEVGSGRGGGLAYAMRRLGPRAAIGVDLSPRAVELARLRHRDVPGLSFFQGDADALVFGAGTFDAVLNVESSHCYGSRAGFLREVARVLRPGGHFLFADYFEPDALTSTRAALLEAGFTIADEEDITRGVVAALERDELRRLSVVERVPRPLQATFRNFAGTTDGRTYRRFRDGSWRYVRFVALRADASKIALAE
jgi:SAM-dependent methyltransferase